MTMDNQHKIIKGYRDLSQEEIDLMNEIKAHGEATQALHQRVAEHLSRQSVAARESTSDFERSRIQHAEPGRWLAMARTDLQVGIMKLVRAVAQPTTF